MQINRKEALSTQPHGCGPSLAAKAPSVTNGKKDSSHQNCDRTILHAYTKGNLKLHLAFDTKIRSELITRIDPQHKAKHFRKKFS